MLFRIPKNRNDLIQKFLIQLYYPDQYWKDIQETKEEIALWLGNFEYSLKILPEGILIGHRVSNLIVNVNNLGDVKCGMIVGFTTFVCHQI